MSDKTMSDKTSGKTWLEPVLRRDLSGVEAPAELWERVQRRAETPRKTATGTGLKPLAWAFAAVLFVMAGVWGMRVHESHAAGPILAERSGGAEHAVSAERAGLALQSGDPVQIRTWVRTNTGLDLALPAVLESSVQMTGVKVVNASAPAVEVTYRVGGRETTLLVARSSNSAGVRHADLRNVNYDGRISWVMRGQVYTLLCASPEDARVACLLCHAS
jgi:hypothetical protein